MEQIAHAGKQSTAIAPQGTVEATTMAGRPRKPTAVHELSGATRKNPARFVDRANEPRPDTPIGEPPADFLRPESSAANRHLRIWHELIAEAPPGVLTGCDRRVLANTCRLQALVEAGERSPAVFAQLRSHLGDLGMTPAGRSKVVATKKKPEGESAWEALARDLRPRAN